MSRPFLHPLELARAARDNDARRAIEALEGKPRNVVIGPVWAIAASTKVGIAIAAASALYFAAEFLR